MGFPSAQVAQPISQQQPQGKGGGAAPMAAQQQFPVGAPSPDNLSVPAVTSYKPQGKGSIGSGGPPPQIQPPQPSIGKGGTTNSATSGQPQMGQPNTYSNTVGPWDNSNTQPQVQSGKGKGH